MNEDKTHETPQKSRPGTSTTTRTRLTATATAETSIVGKNNENRETKRQRTEISITTKIRSKKQTHKKANHFADNEYKTGEL